jgi:hypothetical protein
MDLSDMTEEDLEALQRKVSDEQSNRRCPEFLPGHQSCDKGRSPHDEHGYTMWHPMRPGRIRITWKPVLD